MAMLEAARELAGPVDNESKLLASAAPEKVTTDTNDMPVPPDIKAVFQGGIFLLLLLGACYAAAEIVLPIVLAFVLMLVLQPAMQLLERWRLPRGLAGLAVIVLLFGALIGLATALSGPAANWAQKLPEGIPKLQERLSFLSEPVAAFQKFVTRAEGLASPEANAISVKVEGTGLSDRLITGTRYTVAGSLETVLVLFFLLISGDIFLRRLVEVLPRFKNKRQAVDISNQIESDISAYLFTITLMNGAVGVATGTAVALAGLGDPLLWGTVAFLLNFVPVLSRLCGNGR